MKTIYLLSLCLTLAACTSAKKTAAFNASCGPTPVMAEDILSQFGLTPPPEKILVTRIFGTWCPYCKADLRRMSELFAKGEWRAEDIHVLLIAYKNHSENKATFDKFVRDVLPTYAFPKGTIELVYKDEAYPQLTKLTNKNGKPLFEGWRGVPFAMVFGKDQRLVFRGHFTTSPDSEDQHYKHIRQLQTEICR